MKGAREAPFAFGARARRDLGHGVARANFPHAPARILGRRGAAAPLQCLHRVPAFAARRRPRWTTGNPRSQPTQPRPRSRRRDVRRDDPLDRAGDRRRVPGAADARRQRRARGDTPEAAALLAHATTRCARGWTASPFGRPLAVDSDDDGERVHGAIHGEIAHPFAPLAARLADPAEWCAIVVLHLNVKGCARERTGDGEFVTVYSGRKDYDADRARVRDPLPVPRRGGGGRPRADRACGALWPAGHARLRTHVRGRAGRRPHVRLRALRVPHVGGEPRRDGRLPRDRGQRQGGVHGRRTRRPTVARRGSAACAASSSATRCATSSRSTRGSRRCDAPVGERFARSVARMAALTDRYPVQLVEMPADEYVTIKHREWQRTDAPPGERRDRCARRAVKAHHRPGIAARCAGNDPRGDPGAHPDRRIDPAGRRERRLVMARGEVPLDAVSARTAGRATLPGPRRSRHARTSASRSSTAQLKLVATQQGVPHAARIPGRRCASPAPRSSSSTATTRDAATTARATSRRTRWRASTVCAAASRTNSST